MTAHKHFKAVVRARMARTGEAYTTARSRLLAELRGVALDPVATIDAHDRHCIAVRFTRDGRGLLSGGFGGQARIWSTTDWRLAGELVGHTGSVNGFGLDADGRRVVTVSSDGSVRLWDLRSRSEVAVLAAVRKAGIAVDIRPDGRVAATGGLDGVVRLLPIDGSDGPVPAPVKVGGRVVSVAFDRGGERLAVGTAGAGAVVLAANGAEVSRLAIDPAMGVRWTSDGAFLVVTGGGGVVSVVDAEGWEEVRRIELGLAGMLPSATTPDGALVAVGWERHVGVWRADEEEPAVTVDGLPKGVYALDFSPDGRLLAQGGADGRVRVWRVRR